MLTLEPGFSPSIDGTLLTDQLVNLFSTGRFKRNTPISWSFNEHDHFGFTHLSFLNVMHKFLPDKMPELQEIQKETGNTIKVPSIFSDAFLERYFGAELVKESWKHFSLALFMAKISILNNNSISDQNIDFLTNISIFEESSIFCQKFYI